VVLLLRRENIETSRGIGVEEKETECAGEHSLVLGLTGLLAYCLDELLDRHLGHFLAHFDGIELFRAVGELLRENVVIHEQVTWSGTSELADEILERTDVAPEGEDHALDAVEFILRVLLAFFVLILLPRISRPEFGEFGAAGGKFVVGVAV